MLHICFSAFMTDDMLKYDAENELEKFSRFCVAKMANLTLSAIARL